MRKIQLLTIVVLFSFLATTALAQSNNSEGNSYGYLVAGPGGTSSGGGATLHIAGGGEGVFRNGAGIAGEIGALFPMKDAGDGLGVFSINGSYHFVNVKGKVIPFLTGGYSGFFRGGYANGINVGGGVVYWCKPRLGLRVEVRDNIFVDDGSVNLINVRVGITFR